MMWKVSDTRQCGTHADFVVIPAALVTCRVGAYTHFRQDSHVFERYFGERASMEFTDLPRNGRHLEYEYWQSFLEVVNDREWKFVLTEWAQDLRINRYGVNDRFPTHTDYGSDDMSKLAFVAMLSYDGEYEGGEFLINDSVVPLLEGDVVVFPAYMPHRVRTVTRGERFTLTGWAGGPRFV